MPRMLLFTSMVLAVSVLIFGANLASAQYPNPLGSVTLTSSDPDAQPGQDVPLVCEVLDVTGAPVAGENCVFSIESEPGTDAAVGSKVVVRVTDVFGQARTNLYTGTTPGVVVVRTQAGALSSTILVDVAGGSALPPAAPLEIQPPSTGDGGLAGS
ncbi:MAG: hypothetical protein GEU75_01485 [Dehalococcoidia bacterium]|nr:hypothetical protein [Dehalococcoidia bacterium]